MSIEVTPLGVTCDKACHYCYQDPIRLAGNALSKQYDMDKMKAALLKEGYRFTIFGGEPLLVPIEDLEELWRWGKETFGPKVQGNPNSVQTHGGRITDAHIALFQKYGVGVGISVDGPEELNDARWEGSLERTRAATERTMAAIDKLLAIGHVPSLIVTLTRVNAAPDRLPKLVEWLRDLSQKGLRHVNLHMLEVDGPKAEELVLTSEELVNAMWACYELMKELPLKVAPFTDMISLLKGDDSQVSCIWNACDPYTTNAVRGVDGQGNRGNCGRTCKEGPFWDKADTAGYERYLSLYHTPQEFGGCKGCEWFALCKGNCPGEGPQGDWRGKTTHCETLKVLFGRLAKVTPKAITSRPEDLKKLEQKLIASWSGGQRTGFAEQAHPMDRPHGDTPHGDHNDAVKPYVTHGDHNDNGGAR
jgi:uncharacterized protein